MRVHLLASVAAVVGSLLAVPAVGGDLWAAASGYAEASSASPAANGNMERASSRVVRCRADRSPGDGNGGVLRADGEGLEQLPPTTPVLPRADGQRLPSLRGEVPAESPIVPRRGPVESLSEGPFGTPTPVPVAPLAPGFEGLPAFPDRAQPSLMPGRPPCQGPVLWQGAWDDCPNCGDHGHGGLCDESGWDDCACCARWDLRVDALIFDRTGARTLVLDRRQDNGGVTANAGDLSFNYAAGERFDLSRRNTLGDWDLEAVYFNLDGFHAQLAPGQAAPYAYVGPGYLVNGAAGTYDQFDYLSKLYNAELNLRKPVAEWLTVLLGVRWVELQERFEANRVTPGSRTLLSTSLTSNDLIGLQIGAESPVWCPISRFHLDGMLKAGIFENHYHARTEQPALGLKNVYENDAPAFVGGLGLTGVFEVTRHVALRAGYELLWLESVARASDQAALTNLTTGAGTADANAGILYYGATVGLEVQF